MNGKKSKMIRRACNNFDPNAPRRYVVNNNRQVLLDVKHKPSQERLAYQTTKKAMQAMWRESGK